MRPPAAREIIVPRPFGLEPAGTAERRTELLVQTYSSTGLSSFRTPPRTIRCAPADDLGHFSSPAGCVWPSAAAVTRYLEKLS